MNMGGTVNQYGMHYALPQKNGKGKSRVHLKKKTGINNQ